MQTATNPQTGEKVQWNGSAWVPASGGSPAAQPAMGGPVYGAPPLPKEPANPTGYMPDPNKGPGGLTYQPGGPQDPNRPQPTQAPPSPTQQANTRLDNISNMRKEFNALPEVKNYSTALTEAGKMWKAPNNGQGDLAVIYAFAKIMDPGSVVREGEMDMANSTSSYVQDMYRRFGQITDANRLPESVRQGLIKTAMAAGQSLNQAYNQQRHRYEQIAKQNNFDASQIIGNHLGDAYRESEQGFLHPQEAKPDINSIDFSGNTPHPAMSAPQQAAYDAFFAANPNATADQLQAFGSAIGVNLGNAKEIIDARNKGAGVRPGADAVYKPDEAVVQQKLQEHGGSGAAGIVGAGDTALLGTSDEIIAAGKALGDTLSGQGGFGNNFGQELATEREYQRRLRGDHPVATFVGNAAGSLALPTFGANSLRGVTALGAGYGGLYGAGSGEGGIGGRATNALLGAGAGAASAATLGLAAPVVAKGAQAGARKIFGPLSEEGRAVLQAGDKEGVPVNMSDIYPNARNTVATLETIPGASGPVRAGIGKGSDAIEGRVNALGGPGTAREPGPMGERVYKAGQRFIDDHRKTSDADYGLAEKLGGTVKATPTKAADAARTVIGDLSETANTNKTTLGLYKDVLGDMLDANGNLKPLSINAIRRLRKNIRREMNNRGMVGSAEDRDLQKIVDAASEDMFDALSAHNPRAADAYRKADAGYTQRMGYINDTLKKFMGTRDKPISGEALMSKIGGMAGSGARGNSRELNQFMRSLTNDERADVAASFAQNLGRKSAEEPFSPATFLTNIRNIDERSRIVLFGRSGAKSIENLITLANAKKGTVGRLNNSRSGQVSNYRTVFSSIFFGLPGGGAIAGAATGLNAATGAVGGTAIAAGGVGIARAMAKAMMNEEFTRAVAQAPATASPRAIDAHISQLRKIAAKDPDIRAVVESLEKRLLEAANDNVTKRAAASQPNQRDENNK